LDCELENRPRAILPAGRYRGRRDSTQPNSQANPLQPLLADPLRQCDQILCRADGANPAAAEARNAETPAIRIAIDRRQDRRRILRDAPPFAGRGVSADPVENLQGRKAYS
jgi:hypothetical protein